MEKTSKSLSVRIGEDLHREVRMRAFEEGVAVEALLRGWLRSYAEGSLGEYGPRVDTPSSPPVALPPREPVVIGEITEAVEELRREDRRSATSGKCQMSVPKGTKCKSCGKVH
jgi:transposase-like protein